MYGVWRYTPIQFWDDGYTENGVCFRNVTEEHAAKYAESSMSHPLVNGDIYFFAELVAE